MPSYKVISSDDHVFEPPDLWTSRIEAKFRERAPCVVRLDDGDWWFCDGRKMMGLGGGTQPGKRFEEPDKMTITDLFENVRPGGYIPEEHIKDMAADGVDVSVHYPTVGLIAMCAVEDSGFLTAISQAYNDWVADFCEHFPKQLKGIAMVNVDDVTDGVRQLERTAKLGLIGALITVYPVESRPYSSPEYEPLWAAAQDLDMPLSLHMATNRPGPGQQFQDADSFRPVFQANIDHWVKMSLGDMILSGVFERYPKLRVGSVEQEMAWVPHFLDRLDYTYTQRTQRDHWYRFKEDILPSDCFHRNVFVSFQDDPLGIRDRHIIGVDNLQWGSDYPH